MNQKKRKGTQESDPTKQLHLTQEQIVARLREIMEVLETVNEKRKHMVEP